MLVSEMFSNEPELPYVWIPAQGITKKAAQDRLCQCMPLAAQLFSSDDLGLGGMLKLNGILICIWWIGMRICFSQRQIRMQRFGGIRTRRWSSRIISNVLIAWRVPAAQAGADNAWIPHALMFNKHVFADEEALLHAIKHTLNSICETSTGLELH